jgi:hypothetical protein
LAWRQEVDIGSGNRIRFIAIGVFMSSAKEEVRALISRLPDDCSLEDIQYHLYVLEKVHRGLEAADDKGAIPQEQVERFLDKWLTK